MDTYEDLVSFDIREPEVLMPGTISHAGEVTSWRPLRLTSKDFDITEATGMLPMKQRDQDDGDDEDSV